MNAVKQDLNFSLYQKQIHKTKYSRWIDEENRREEWDETVNRFTDFLEKYINTNYSSDIDNKVWDEIKESILSQDVLPSMRGLMTAGKALERDEVAQFNCSYIAVDSPRAFDEALYLLCCGVGVGFSVENQYVSKLPEVPEELFESDTTIVVADSKIGWANATRQMIAMLYSGFIPKWDLSKIRPEGARLKTFGGRASGPKPLDNLLNFLVETFEASKGRKLTSYDCHSIMCKVGDIVVVGGVRRSALISLSDPYDVKMRDAKSGQWWETAPHLALANNSAVWEEKPSIEHFTEEWLALMKSGSGERGFYNRKAAKDKVYNLGRRDTKDFGLNPCAEVFLRNKGLCNLSQITIRPEDTEETLIHKARIASIIGTFQSSITNFRYLSSAWKKNAEEERLLGVGMTGVMENNLLNGTGDKKSEEDLLDKLRETVINTNIEFAEKIGINPSVATTCIKPAGNSTQLVGGHASGLHEAYAPFYIRRNRANKTDPVAQLMYYQGVPCEDEILHPDTTWVFSFPMKAPESAIVRSQRSAIETLEHWKTYADHWCEHNPSITVSVKEDEWLEVGNWLYENFDKVPAVSFLPYSEHTYQQAPYEEIDEETYNKLISETPSEIDWSLLETLEKTDNTEGVQELACFAGAGCEI